MNNITYNTGIGGQAVNQSAPVNSLNITTLTDLQNYSQGNIVRLPDFAEGQPFIARMRRPSLLSLVKNGKIPNSLISAANEIFSQGIGSYDVDNQDSLKDMFGILDVICEASLVEPTYQQIKDAGLELSDDQLMFIFSYAQQGVKALESFRKE